MFRTIAVGVVVLVVLCVVLLPGCGGSGNTAPGVNEAGLKIREFAGVGYTGVKPSPFPLPDDGQMQTQSVASKLALNQVPLSGLVPPALINWYRIPPVTNSQSVVVTVQPTENKDSDLFAFEAGVGGVYADNMLTLGFSRRTPTDDYDYSPDWASFGVTGGTGLPVANIAVNGFQNEAGDKHYKVEADVLRTVVVNGPAKTGSVVASDSHWYQFGDTNGVHYTITGTAVTGDPDIYVYQGNSAGFIGSANGIGSGSVPFTATATGTVFVRVYGFNGSNNYSLTVTSP